MLTSTNPRTKGLKNIPKVIAQAIKTQNYNAGVHTHAHKHINMQLCMHIHIIKVSVKTAA